MSREIKQLIVGNEDTAIFEMTNGYFYVVNIDRDTIGVFKDYNQYIRFDPYILEEYSYSEEELEAMENLALSLPAVVMSSSIVEKAEEL